MSFATGSMYIKEKLALIFGLVGGKPVDSLDVQQTGQSLGQPESEVEPVTIKWADVGGMTDGDFKLLDEQIQSGVYRPIPNSGEVIPDKLEEKGYRVARETRISLIPVSAFPRMKVEEVATGKNVIATWQITEAKGRQRLRLVTSLEPESHGLQNVATTRDSVSIRNFDGESIPVLSASFYHRKQISSLPEPAQLEDYRLARSEAYFGDQKAG